MKINFLEFESKISFDRILTIKIINGKEKVLEFLDDFKEFLEPYDKEAIGDKMLKIDFLNATYLVTEKIDVLLDSYKTFLVEETEFLFELQKMKLFINANAFTIYREELTKIKFADFSIHHFYLIKLQNDSLIGGKCVCRQPLIFEYRDAKGMTSKTIPIEHIYSYVELDNETAMKIFYSLGDQDI